MPGEYYKPAFEAAKEELNDDYERSLKADVAQLSHTAEAHAYRHDKAGEYHEVDLRPGRLTSQQAKTVYETAYREVLRLSDIPDPVGDGKDRIESESESETYDGFE